MTANQQRSISLSRDPLAAQPLRCRVLWGATPQLRTRMLKALSECGEQVIDARRTQQDMMNQTAMKAALVAIDDRKPVWLDANVAHTLLKASAAMSANFILVQIVDTSLFQPGITVKVGEPPIQNGNPRRMKFEIKTNSPSELLHLARRVVLTTEAYWFED